ncbi:MAG: hypothetical protein JXA01_03615 [Dehalococcoidia bacterium]|nr:hypothetical protein [Dehalococcoidia bacterium]
MELWRNLLNRMTRAAGMDTSLYKETGTEEEAVAHAVMIALLCAVATGLGMGLTAPLGGAGLLWLLWGLVSGFFASLVGWSAWVLITHFATTTFLRGTEEAGMTKLTIALGFANSPGILRLLIFIPMIGWFVIALTGIWTLATGAIAVKKSLGYTAGKALAACILGWLFYMAILLLVYFWIPSQYKMPPGMFS